MTNRTAEIATYGLLLRNQWRVYVRELRARQHLFVWIFLGIMSLCLGFILVTTGWFFDRFSILIQPGVEPAALINRFLLPVFLGLFGLRFLFQRTPARYLRPYLHLPVARSHLIRFFQATSLLSLHNIGPLVFLLPFWSRHVLGVYPLPGALAWLTGIVMLLVAANFANLVCRTLLARHERSFLFFLALLTALVYVDDLAGTRYVQTYSAHLFDTLLQTQISTLLLVLLLPVWTTLASGHLLLKQLRRAEEIPASTRRWSLPRFLRRGAYSPLVLLELRLIVRNRRPRHYLLISLLFSTLYLIFLLASPFTRGEVILGGVIGLFASGGFVLNYGQLMFSWESSFFDGLLVRPLAPRRTITAKMLLLQGSCLVLFLLSAPLFLWLKPALVPLHVAFLFYNAGITTVLVLFLALRNRQYVDVSRSGAFFNYEGFSAAHWLWFFPTAVPPSVLLLVMRDAPATGLLWLGGAGLVSLLATPLWITLFTHLFARRRRGMAEGFRRRRHR